MFLFWSYLRGNMPVYMPTAFLVKWLRETSQPADADIILPLDSVILISWTKCRLWWKFCSSDHHSVIQCKAFSCPLSDLLLWIIKLL